MAEYKLDAIVVLGDDAPNPYRDYLTKRANAKGSVFKKRDQEPIFVLITSMERGEAAKSGLKVLTLDDFGRLDLIKNYKGTDEAFTQELFCNTLRQLEITGRVGFFGVADVNTVLIMTSTLAAGVPDLEVAVSGVSDPFEHAYATKEADEDEGFK